MEFGEYALPLAFELAKKLRKAPRKIAEEIVVGLALSPALRSSSCGRGIYQRAVKREELANALIAEKCRVPRLLPAKFWSNIPASIPTRLRT